MQFISAAQLAEVKAQDVALPKRQVVAPVTPVAMVPKVVIPAAGKLIGVMVAELTPTAILKTPELGKDARLPLCVTVPVTRAEWPSSGLCST